MIFSHPEPMLEKLGDGQGGQPYQYELSQFAQKEPFSIRSIQTSVEQRVVGYKQDMVVMCQRHPTHISTAIANIDYRNEFRSFALNVAINKFKMDIFI